VLQTNIYLDAVVYGQAGLKAAIEAGSTDRLLFGMFMTRIDYHFLDIVC
jgi:hypothetical protein